MQRLQCQCKRDPLEVEIWNSWQSEVDEWETENFTENELVDILFEVSCSSGLGSLSSIACDTTGQHLTLLASDFL